MIAVDAFWVGVIVGYAIGGMFFLFSAVYHKRWPGIPAALVIVALWPAFMDHIVGHGDW